MRSKLPNKLSGSLIAGCAIAVLISAAGQCAYATAAVATTTTLAITSGGHATASVTAGSAVTLTATVTAGSTKVTTGLVNFCDASVSYCTDIHLIGSAQLTSAGTAVLSVEPAIGSRQYKAVFAGTNTEAGSASSASAFTVSGRQPSVTTITTFEDGETNIPQMAMVGSGGMVAPSGEISFLDVSQDNAVVGTATLEAGTTGLALMSSANLNLPSTYPSVYSVSAAAADFNGDGFLDIVATGNSGGLDGKPAVASVDLGDGKGGFTAAAGATLQFASSITRSILAVGDFNSDGKVDAAVIETIQNTSTNPPGAATPTLTVLLGDGDGSFTTGQSIQVSSDVVALIVADLNGDGIADLATVDGKQQVVSIFTGVGDGTFNASTSAAISATDYPAALVAGDFNGDGVTDLAFAMDANAANPGTVAILLGKGDGTFSPAASLAVGAGPDSIVAGDFNGDGKLDLAVANGLDATVSILLGNGDGSFAPAHDSPIPTFEFNTLLTVGDFNGDGKLDIASPTSSGEGMLLGNGDGTFVGQTVLYAAPENISVAGYPVALADFNGDGLTDVVAQDVFLLSVTETAIATANAISIPPATEPQLLAASYAGNSTFAASESATVSVGTGPVAPTVTLTASPSTAEQGAPVTLTATLAASGNLPTGTVTFLMGGSSLGSGTLNSSGVATYSTTTLPLGGDSITASYGGDEYNTAATSAPVMITVETVPLVVAVPVPPAVTPGSTATATATFTASSTYAGTLNLSCSLTTSPKGAQSPPSCSLNPTTLTFKAGGTGSSAMSVTTTSASTTASLREPSRKSVWGLGGGGSALAVLLLCGIPARRRRWLSMLMLLWVVVASAAIGCGGAGAGVAPKGTSIPATTAGNYTFTLTGTDSKDSTVTVSATN
jgi:hypothetical protein